MAGGQVLALMGTEFQRQCCSDQGCIPTPGLWGAEMQWDL